jgi:hypothetical protein
MSDVYHSERPPLPKFLLAQTWPIDGGHGYRGWIKKNYIYSNLE